jgi:DNA polymerase
MDFETYSEAGYVWDEERKRWRGITPTASGIVAVGAAVYSEHPSTEVLCLAYNLKNGTGPKMWVPGCPPPADLFQHIASGGLIEAHNSSFEFLIWQNVCNARMGWPALPIAQLRCSASKAAAHALPSALGPLAEVLGVAQQKMTEGKRLIKKFSCPHTPTKKVPAKRIRMEDDLADGALMLSYCAADIEAESAVSAVTPDLTPLELDTWLLDQRINMNGVAIDLEALETCVNVVEQATEKYTAELVAITGGAVSTAGEVAKIKRYLLSAHGAALNGLTKGDVESALSRDDLPPVARRVLEIRASLGAASVKKLFSIQRRVSADGRLRGLFQYCGAERTGRFAGRGPQPQNLPNSGLEVLACQHCRITVDAKSPAAIGGPITCACGGEMKTEEWGVDAVDEFLHSSKELLRGNIEHTWPNPIAAVSGCLRGLFVAAPGHDFICSDYSAIEAVVLAALAGEEWRLEVFRTHGKIYEMSASKISGVPFEDMMAHKETTGQDHPLRKKIGKVAELASGYQGGLGAWKAFGADKHLSEPEIKNAIKAWRKESPAIVSFWYGVEDAAIRAVQNPGHCFQYREILFGVKSGVLHVRLPSGRDLHYHDARVQQVVKFGRRSLALTFMGRDSLTKKWVRMDTYGGKLTENITQAVARDILTHAMLNLDRNGYPPVLHIHDEIVSEVPQGTGDVGEFETLMAQMPAWCASWPIRATGGWRGRRYRKD